MYFQKINKSCKCSCKPEFEVQATFLFIAEHVVGGYGMNYSKKKSRLYLSTVKKANERIAMHKPKEIQMTSIMFNMFLSFYRMNDAAV